MAFLDNSGDIILDAVLTDTGRLRLAQGDGSFKITKFALGDDEINYGNYDKDHASGSAYYDLEILQTPVLEAFTNNTANLNSKLMSISRTNLLYMPELLINARQPGPNTNYQPLPSRWYYRSDSDGSTDVHTSYLNTRFVVAVDNDTWLTLSNNLNAAGGGQSLRGAIQGYKHDNNNGQPAGSLIRVDQGMNTDQINPLAGMDSDLLETQYIIDPQVFKGPRGTSLMFRLHASTELQYSNYLFTQIGKQLTETEAQQQLGISTGVNGNLGAESTGNGTAYVIDTTIRVVGANTGFRIDIPVRYLKIE